MPVSPRRVVLSIESPLAAMTKTRRLYTESQRVEGRVTLNWRFSALAAVHRCCSTAGAAADRQQMQADSTSISHLSFAHSLMAGQGVKNVMARQV